MTLVFDPTAPSRVPPQDLHRTVDDLRGKVIGFVDNTKPNFHFLIDDLAEILVERYGVREVMKRGKARLTIPAPGAVLDELARECDVVITGLGD